MAASQLLIPFLSAVLLLLFDTAGAQTADFRGGYWFPDSGLAAADIESNHFTHLFCAFAGVDPDTFQLTVPAENRQQFMNFTRTVESKNPSVRTLLSVGGGEANVTTFTAMASQSGRRRSFINTSISSARYYNFHGLDIDWQYPSDPTQMSDFGSLLTEWRAAVAAEARTSGRPPLLLSAAVLYFSYYYSPDVPYPVRTISNSLDWINLMAYDFFAPGWTPTITGPPAALFNPGREESGDYGVSTWIEAGLEAKKIVFGMPFYGWSWRLNDSGDNGLYSPANGKGLAV